MNKYCYIIPRTPDHFKTKVREDLWVIAKRSLFSQTCKDWTAIIIYDKNEKIEDDSRLVYIESEVVKKGEKIEVAIEYILKNDKPEYLIRLDDDDIMMPDALKIANEFDVFADNYQIFYDISSTMMSAIILPWLANTIIHKREYAIQYFEDSKKHLINHDHSLKWNEYYKDKKIQYTDIENPLYVRIMSPTSVTANIVENYSEYLNKYGKWDSKYPQGMTDFISSLTLIKEKYKMDVNFKPSNRWDVSVKRFIRYVLNKLSFKFI